ncbi:MAG: TIGR03016 family PEP-CTERM system-associated outer membrane protein [Hydrogenophilales bacterium]|nr:TIGR03016 family PEP-CTERM system-associated outer membrane protein [Hydrogenophilales bacterium]
MAMAFAPTAHAVDWRFEPYVNASATYTDNARQSSSNPQDALIFTETPGFYLRSEGSRRVHASLQYGLTGVERIGNDQNNDLYHNLNAVGNAELLKDFLFIDGNASISQQLISLLGSPADATTNNSNRTTVGLYSISPYVQQRLGTFAFAQVRYTASGAIFQNNVAPNANSNAISASLSSGTRFTDLSWGLNYSLRKVQNRNAINTANNTDVTFESASATAGYALTRQFRVFGTIGHDSNDYLSSTGTSGAFYSAGFGWSPTRRTSLEASAGERYFGRTFSLAANHRTRLSQWTVRYSEDVSDISQQLLQQSSRTFWVCQDPSTGQLGAFPTDVYPNPPRPVCLTSPATPFELAALGVPLTNLVANGDIGTSIATGIFIIKNFNAGVSWDLGKLGFGLSAQDTKRLYQMLGNAQDHIQGVTGSVSYRLSDTVTASSALSLTRTSLDSSLTNGVPRQDDLISLSLGLNRRFTDKLNGALTFRRTQRSSNAANANYDEDSLMASVNMRF